MDFNWFTWQTGADILDIVIVSILIYGLLVIIRNTRAMNLFKGILFIVAIRAISFFLRLNTLNWVMDQLITWGVVAMIIIFQPEIRRGLEQIGRGRFLRARMKATPNGQAKAVVEHLSTAIQYMARRRIGALIVIEMTNDLEEYVNTGIRLDSDISSQLLINLFIPNTPLHDGSIIIRGRKIVSASSYLPLSENPLIPKELGTRHRAGIGLSEVTDALTLIVSEETGEVSIARTNQLQRDLTPEQVTDILLAALEPRQDTKKPTGFFQELLDSFGLGGRHDG